MRTQEERVTALAARAQALEDAARSEREGAERAIVRREQRSLAAASAQATADTAYEALIQIEISIQKALAERQRLELGRTDRDGEILAVRGKSRELTLELEQLTSSVHRDEIVRAEQRMRIEQLENRAVEELGVDVATLISEYGPTNDVPTFIEDDDGQTKRLKILGGILIGGMLHVSYQVQNPEYIATTTRVYQLAIALNQQEHYRYHLR